MRVDLRCSDARVPKQFLNLAQIGAAGEQMGGEAVPHRVWAEFIGDTDPGTVLFEKFPDPFAPQALPTRREEQIIGGRQPALGQPRTFVFQIIAHGLAAAAPHRDDALLVPFAVTDAKAFVEPYIAQAEVRDF